MIKMFFWVHDRPVPQGSKRHVGRGIMVESSNVKPWREAVRLAAIEAVGDHDGPVFAKGTPVRLVITFHFKRPQAHYRTGKRADELRDDAPHYMATRPDVSKLIRSTEDALTAAGVWHDDAQVAVLHAYQVYNDQAREGAAIVITEAKER